MDNSSNQDAAKAVMKFEQFGEAIAAAMMSKYCRGARFHSSRIRKGNLIARRFTIDVMIDEQKAAKDAADERKRAVQANPVLFGPDGNPVAGRVQEDVKQGGDQCSSSQGTPLQSTKDPAGANRSGQ